MRDCGDDPEPERHRQGRAEKCTGISGNRNQQSNTRQPGCDRGKAWREFLGEKATEECTEGRNSGQRRAIVHRRLCHADAVHTHQERRLEADQAVARKGDEGCAEGQCPECRLLSEFLERLEEAGLFHDGRLRIRIAARWLTNGEPEDQRDENTGYADDHEDETPAFHLCPVHAGEQEAEAKGIHPAAKGFALQAGELPAEQLRQHAADGDAHRIDADRIGPALGRIIIGDD